MIRIFTEPRPSAVNTMLSPVFAAERRLQTAYRSVSAADARAQQQTRRPQLLLSIDVGTDRRNDTRPLHRSFSTYYMRAASVLARLMKIHRVCRPVQKLAESNDRG